MGRRRCWWGRGWEDEALEGPALDAIATAVAVKDAVDLAGVLNPGVLLG